MLTAKRTKILTLIALYTGMLGMLLSAGATSTMLPAAALDIGGQEIYSLVNTLGGVVGAVAMPLFGFFSAKYPRTKPVLLGISLVVSALVMLFRAFATDMWQIILPGMLAGAGSPALFVVGFSLVRELFGRADAAKYIGLTATFQAIGNLSGPLLCGYFVDMGNWRIINHFVWPLYLVGGVCALLTIRAYKERTDGGAKNTARFDLSGAVCVTIFLICFILALSLGTSFAPFGSLLNNVLFAGAAIFLVAFILIARKKGDQTIIPVNVLKDRSTVTLALGTFFNNLSNMACFFFIPSFALYVMKVSAMEAGLSSTVMSIAMLFMGPVFSKFILKSGSARGVHLSMTALRILVSLCLVFMLRADTPLWVLYVLMFAMGFCSCSVGSVSSLAPQLQIAEPIRVQANSVIQLTQNFGSSIGTCLYSVVIGLAGIEAGMTIAFIIATVAAGSAFLSGLFIPAGSKKAV